MVVGAVWLPIEKVRETSIALHDLKRRYGLDPRYEMKWTKVSDSKMLGLYKSFIENFFDEEDLHFRAIIIDKEILRHLDFKQTHDDWYYKMFFLLVNRILQNDNRYNLVIK